MAPMKSNPKFQTPEYLGPHLIHYHQEEGTAHVPGPEVTYLNYLGPYLVEQRDEGDTNNVLRRTRANLYQATGSTVARKLTSADLTAKGTPKRPRGRPRKSTTPIREPAEVVEEQVDGEVSPAPTFSDLGRGMFSVSPEAEEAESIETEMASEESEDERLGRANALITSLAASRRQVFDRCMALSQRLRIQLTLRAHEIEVLHQECARQQEVDEETRPYDEAPGYDQADDNRWWFPNWRQHCTSARAFIIGLRDVVLLAVLFYAGYRWFYRHEFAWADRLRREAVEEL